MANEAACTHAGNRLLWLGGLEDWHATPHNDVEMVFTNSENPMYNGKAHTPVYLRFHRWVSVNVKAKMQHEGKELWDVIVSSWHKSREGYGTISAALKVQLNTVASHYLEEEQVQNHQDNSYHQALLGINAQYPYITKCSAKCQVQWYIACQDWSLDGWRHVLWSNKPNFSVYLSVR